MSTEHIEALKLALEGAANYIDALGGDSRKYRQALAEQPAQQEPGRNHWEDGDVFERIGAMKKQPAQQQEPVAWVCEGSSSDEKHAIDYWPGDVDDLPIGTKLYTSPPASKPLTDEEIEFIRVDQEFTEWSISEAAFKYAARAIETAHGIKENT